MWIKQSYDDDFEHFMLDMKDKYPKSIFEINGINDENLDRTKFAKKYFTKKNVANISVDSNANVQIKNIAAFNTERNKGLDKLDSLFLFWKTAKKLYGLREANRLVEKELNKDLNIQDSNNFYLPYCFAFDVYDLLTVGLPFVTNYPSNPAKHSDVFWQHTIQLLQYAAPQMMGATAIPNFIVIYSALLKYDSEDKSYPIPNYNEDKKMFERYVKQRFQEMIFALNQPLRQVQSTFTNITIFDTIFMKEICSKYVVKDNLIDPEFAMYIQKLFLETVNELNNSRIATFPILTVQFKKDENFEIEDKEFLKFISKINLPTGHLNIFNDISLNALSSCCRLVNDIEDLIKATKDEYMNLIGGSSIKVGSFGVVTLPLVRMALKAKNEEEFFELLRENTEDAYKINHCRRTLIIEKIDQGEMPLYTHGFIDINNQYSTLGINGFYECLEILGYDIRTEEGMNFGIKIVELLEKISEERMRKYGYKTNIEQIPAEQTSSKLAQADSILYNQNKYTIYGNQFIPLTINGSIFERIQIQATLEKYFSGGTILHINFSEKIPTSQMMEKCIKYVIKSGVKYFAINYFFNICKNSHYTVNNKEKCEICSEDIIDKMTRIVGFFVPLSSWSKNRVDEFNERKKYDISSISIPQ
jgi:ribonucleoside-triphosphate reductase